MNPPNYTPHIGQPYDCADLTAANLQISVMGQNYEKELDELRKQLAEVTAERDAEREARKALQSALQRTADHFGDPLKCSRAALALAAKLPRAALTEENHRNDSTHIFAQKVPFSL